MAAPPSRVSARVLSLAVLFCGSAHGLDPGRRLTQYAHRVWQTEQGLREAGVNSLEQTHDGYLWLGTYAGLIRFDGVKLTTIPGSKGILENMWIRSMVEDSDGRLWLATNGAGLVRLQNGVMTQYTEKSGLPSDALYCVISGPSGLWACTAKGLARFADGKIETYSTEQGLPDSVVYAACNAKDGTLWAGSEYSKVSMWNGSRFVVHILRSIPPDTAVRAMLCSNDGSVWIGATRGLIHLKDGQESLLTVNDGLANNFVVSLSESRDGSIWIGTRNGFSRLRGGEIESFRQEDGLSQRRVLAIHEDSEGSLWVGTNHGLDQFLDGRAITYMARDGLPSDDAGPVIEDRRGNVWVGTPGRGLCWFDNHHFSVLARKQGVSDNVYALLNDDNGGFWAGTSEGIKHVVDGRVVGVYTVDSGMPSNITRSLFRDGSGTLWAGTASGPARLENGRFDQPAALRGPLATEIVSIGEDRQGRLYFAAGRGGVFTFANGETREVTLNAVGSPARADAFYTDQQGLLWIGTVGSGLKLIRNGVVTSYVTRDGLFDNSIYAIVPDAADRLWLASPSGIYSVKRAELLRFAEGQIRRIEASGIDLLRPIECKPGVQPGAIRVQDGRLWFSTTRGLIVFDPNQVKTPPPPPLIESLLVNGESKAPDQNGRLGPGRKNLEFQFTDLSFIDPGRIAFRYILEGFDKDWTDARTRREAFYTNLPPGDFRFRVTACNPDGLCNPTDRWVALTLAPYYYQRPWFFPLLAAILAFSGWAAHRLRVHRLQEQMGLVLTERNRIARELHDTLIQGFSGLTLQLQAMAGRLRSAEERATLDDIIRDAGTYLQETRQSVSGLRSGPGPVRHLASAIAESARHITAQKSVRLNLKLGKNEHFIPAEVQYNLLRIAQEAIANSVRHARAHNIEVALDCSGAGICLAVKDDGSGFDPAQIGEAGPGHYGLVGMRERAAEVGASLDLSTTPGKGTTIRVQVPGGKSGDWISSIRREDRDEAS
jgi:signal transduction histidine kinase/ligand-binding sensor domain-containing protein